MAKPKTTTDEHGQIRDRRGEWRSGGPIYLEPLLNFPTNPKRILAWLFGVPGFFLPWFALNMVLNGFQTALGPALSHSGFDELVFGDEFARRNDRLMHYLHHRYHNVDFGESNVPLDKWFGSLHDGTPEVEAHLERVRAQKT